MTFKETRHQQDLKCNFFTTCNFN